MDGEAINLEKGVRYTLSIFLVLGLVFAGLAWFNVSVDPYHYFESPTVENYNERKPYLFYHLSNAKSFQFMRRPGANLIIGSSRAGSGINPRHPSIEADNYYNFATTASQPVVDLMKLRARLERGKLERLMYFVDFFGFNSYGQFPDGYLDSFEDRIGNDLSIATARQLLSDYSAYFWSYSTIHDSIETIRQQDSTAQGKSQYTVLHDTGLWNLFLPRDRKLLRTFRDLENSYMRGNWFPPADPRFSLEEVSDATNTPFRDFREIMTLAREHDVAVTLAILPVHARLLETLDHVGLWPHYEQWKREIIAINESVAASFNATAYPLWDFNGYNEFATEKVTADTRPEDLRWMYDSAHMTDATGAIILDIMNGRTPARNGGLIHSDNIESWLVEQRGLREIYRSENPEVVRQVKRNVRLFRRTYPFEVYPLKR